MQTTTNSQLGLLDSLMIAPPPNDFLERLDRTLDWVPLEKALQAMYPATTGRPPCAPLALFKMSLLQHCYGLSDPQCEELVADRLSWRRFVGLGLQEAVPDGTSWVTGIQGIAHPNAAKLTWGIGERGDSSYSYSNWNEVFLLATPEPSAVSFLCFGGGALLYLRRNISPESSLA